MAGSCWIFPVDIGHWKNSAIKQRVSFLTLIANHLCLIMIAAMTISMVGDGCSILRLPMLLNLVLSQFRSRYGPTIALRCLWLQSGKAPPKFVASRVVITMQLRYVTDVAHSFHRLSRQFINDNFWCARLGAKPRIIQLNHPLVVIWHHLRSSNIIHHNSTMSISHSYGPWHAEPLITSFSPPAPAETQWLPPKWSIWMAMERVEL